MLYAALEGHELARTSRQLFGAPAFALLRDYVLRRQQAGAFRQGNPLLLVFALVAVPAYFSMAHRVLGMPIAGIPERAAADLFTRIVLDGVRVHADDSGARPPKGSRRRADRRPSARPQVQARRSK